MYRQGNLVKARLQRYKRVVTGIKQTRKAFVQNSEQEDECKNASNLFVTSTILAKGIASLSTVATSVVKARIMVNARFTLRTSHHTGRHLSSIMRIFGTPIKEALRLATCTEDKQ